MKKRFSSNWQKHSTFMISILFLFCFLIPDEVFYFVLLCVVSIKSKLTFRRSTNVFLCDRLYRNVNRTEIPFDFFHFFQLTFNVKIGQPPKIIFILKLSCVRPKDCAVRDCGDNNNHFVMANPPKMMGCLSYLTKCCYY